MRGEANAHELRDAEHIGEASTARGYALYDLGEYPAMTRGDGPVQGEVWDVAPEELTRLDAFEGVAYRREQIVLDDGSTVFAYLGDVPAGAPRIAAWRQGK